MWMMLVVNVFLYTWTSTKHHQNELIQTQWVFKHDLCLLKCFRPLWPHRLTDTMSYIRHLRPWNEQELWSYIYLITSIWIEISCDRIFCMISWFWLQFSEKMTISPSAILRSGRPDYEPQKSADRKDLLLLWIRFNSNSIRLKCTKKMLLFIITVIVLSNSLLT